jgi:hypothetical protein
MTEAERATLQGILSDADKRLLRRLLDAGDRYRRSFAWRPPERRPEGRPVAASPVRRQPEARRAVRRRTAGARRRARAPGGDPGDAGPGEPAGRPHRRTAPSRRATAARWPVPGGR